MSGSIGCGEGGRVRTEGSGIGLAFDKSMPAPELGCLGKVMLATGPFALTCECAGVEPSTIGKHAAASIAASNGAGCADDRLGRVMDRFSSVLESLLGESFLRGSTLAEPACLRLCFISLSFPLG